MRIEPLNLCDLEVPDKCRAGNHLISAAITKREQQNTRWVPIRVAPVAMRCCAALLLVHAAIAGPYEDRSCRVGTPVPMPDGAKWGYITASGRRIPARFDAAGYFREGIARVCVANLCGLIDENGHFVTPLRAASTNWLVSAYSEGLAAVNGKEGSGYVDRLGAVAIPFRYRYAGTFHRGMARVRDGDDSYFLDHVGRRITPKFQGAADFHDGLAAVSVGGREGYIRENGRFAIPAQFVGGDDFSEGLARIRIDGQTAYINRNGVMQFNTPFSEAGAFSQGLAVVEKNGFPAISTTEHL